jgi:hypothetical protein
MKICTKCKIEKPKINFWPDNRRQSGLMARCKSCKASDARIYRQSRPNLEKERYQRDKIGIRERHLKRKYGVTLAVYDAMFRDQNGCCAICGKSQSKALDVDHCHETGEVRGLLCTNCNRMLGHAHDDTSRLIKAANYLSSRKSRQSSSTLTGSADHEI